MVQYAFELSEKYNTPVLLRPTTRVDHAYQSLEFPELQPCRTPGTFEKDSSRWVIFPRASYLNHKRIFERNEKTLPQEFSESKWNSVKGSGKIAFAAGGISWCYLKEALEIITSENPKLQVLKDAAILKIGTPYPFPKQLAKKFLQENAEVIVFEELDPVIEENLISVCGEMDGPDKIKIHGKKDGLVPEAGELSTDIVKSVLQKFIEQGGEKLEDYNSPKTNNSSKPELPVRPPVLCAGCPHRGAFYAVKQAMKGKKTAFCGDIGCYTLGNAKPLDMCDTCLCMGADITMAQGFYHNEPDRLCFSFIGDSTFFASGITGVVNAVYNQSHQTICILDNSTTAMTGHQPHPGTGMTMMGQVVDKISIPKILEAIGVNPVIEVDPFNQEASVEAVKTVVAAPGVSAVIFKSPCISIASKLGYKMPGAKKVDTAKCIGCRKCINELGCPALSVSAAKNAKGKQIVEIDSSLCTGCGLCASVCNLDAIN
jgi:indolepyruvate ferredoxin oxidoreductase alpha subunit